jgi:aminoglycoside/choline kinase family phosphotransferase
MNEISEFLKNTDWANAQQIPMGADMGLRRYMRLEKDGKRALFMNTSVCGVRESLQNYIMIAEYLRKFGISIPDIYMYDLDAGYSVIEEVGQKSFGDKIKEGYPGEEIYQIATNVLIQIKNHIQDNDLGLIEYNQESVRKKICQFVNYYIPAVTNLKSNKNLLDEFENIIEDIAKKLGSCPMGFCHADYHLENLMWCPEKTGSYGLIDFQDAFWGFQGYDLLNLLEDARQTVPAEIKKIMKAQYCDAMSSEELQNFNDWYALMSMHFHCRVIGLFIKFSQEKNTTEFLAHIPRLQGYILRNLKNPIFVSLNKWFDSNDINFDVAPKV